MDRTKKQAFGVQKSTVGQDKKQQQKVVKKAVASNEVKRKPWKRCCHCKTTSTQFQAWRTCTCGRQYICGSCFEKFAATWEEASGSMGWGECNDFLDEADLTACRNFGYSGYSECQSLLCGKCEKKRGDICFECAESGFSRGLESSDDEHNLYIY